MRWLNITRERFYTLIQFYQIAHMKMWLLQAIVTEKPCEPNIGCAFYDTGVAGNGY